MKIIGIDPGYDRLGVAVIEKDKSKNKETLLYSDCLQTSIKNQIHKRLLLLGTEISKILDRFSPDVMAIESLFVAKNQKTAMRVSEAKGIVAYEATKRNIPIFEYSPMQIKMAITGNGKSDKQMIEKMIGLLINIPKNKKLDDELDAIAVALAFEDKKIIPR